MSVVDNLVVRLMGNSSSYSKMITSATANTQKFTNTVSKASAQITRMGKATTDIGKKLTMGATLPAIFAGGASVKAFADFDQALTQSTSIMGVSRREIEQLKNTALELSTSGFAVQTPKEMAESYFFLASAGLNATESIRALPQVAQFATAGAFDMALATDLLTDAQSALGLSVGDVEEKMRNMGRVSDVLVKANTLANATVQQFSESITNDAGAALKTFNKDVEEGVAVLAAYADQGIKGMVAGSQLGRVTRLLSTAALKNADAHKRLGFSVFDSNGTMRNYADIVQQLEKITAGMSDETRAATLEQLGFQARVQNAILPLIGMSEQIKTYEMELRKAGGTTATVANNQLQSFNNQMKIAKNRSTVLAIAIGQSLAPIVLQFNQLLGRLTKWFLSLNPEFQKMVALTLIATIAIGPLLVMTGMLITAVGKVATVISLVAGITVGWIGAIVLAIAAIAGLVAGARYLLGSWEAVGELFKNVGELIADALVFAVRVAGRVWQTFFGWFIKKATQVFTADWSQAILKGLSAAKDLILRFGTWVEAKLREIFTGKEAGTFEDFVAQYVRYNQEGEQAGSLVGALSNAVGEEYGRFQQVRSGKSLLSPEAKAKMSDSLSPIQSAIGQGKDKATNSLGDIAKNTEMMNQLLQGLGQENPVYLSPLALGTQQ